jgi:hypothetical protein
MSEKKSKPRAKKATKTTPSKAKGLGDTVEKITEATGIKAVVEKFSEITGLDCGCDVRKEKLNKLFPYKSRVLCLEQPEYNQLDSFFKSFDGREIKESWQEPLSRIHARIFEHKFYIPCSCSPKEWNRVIQDLKKVYKEYDGA